MFTASIDLTDLRRLRGALRVELGAACAHAVAAACRDGATEAVRVHPYTDRTGDLTRSIRGSLLEAVFGQDGEATGEIVAGQGLRPSYASYVENGTRPHDIRPKDPGGVLAFAGRDGDTVFARIVHHPGTRAYPFMGPAYLKAERVLEAELAAAVARACARIED